MARTRKYRTTNKQKWAVGSKTIDNAILRLSGSYQIHHNEQIIFTNGTDSVAKPIIKIKHIKGFCNWFQDDTTAWFGVVRFFVYYCPEGSAEDGPTLLDKHPEYIMAQTQYITQSTDTATENKTVSLNTGSLSRNLSSGDSIRCMILLTMNSNYSAITYYDSRWFLHFTYAIKAN